jgi:hypothetical protein
VHFPTIEQEPNLAEPWVDVRIERAAVWGVAGTPLARAARYDGPAMPITLPPIDLVSLR